MVKRSKKKNVYRRRYLWPAVIVIVVLLAAGITYYLHNAAKTTSQTSSTSTGTFSRTAAPPADNTENNVRKGSSNPSSTLDNGGSATTPVSNSSINPQIVSANVNNGNLHIGTLVNGTSSGTCTLTASQPGQSTLQLGSSTVKLDVNAYDCGAFNIPTSKFPSSGNWELLLTVTSSGSSGSDKTAVII